MMQPFPKKNLSSLYKNVLVVVKQTPYESYLQLKAQGKAPVALRWERLRNRYEQHKQCVNNVVETLTKLGVPHVVIGREEMYKGSLINKDLVISVGGDGTVLNASSFLNDQIPILGINSDPSSPEELNLTNQIKDERRSRGALCAVTANNLHEILPKIIIDKIVPKTPRSRIRCIVSSTYTETKLPPALNDILIAHPIPAAVSRFRVTLKDMTATREVQDSFSFNCWSSGLWISTGTGSTAAMHAAGGKIVDPTVTSLQYLVREHLVEAGSEHVRDLGHGFISDDQLLHLRWNSQFGTAFVDGAYFKHNLELGDEITFDSNGPVLQLFDYTDIL